MMDLAPILSGLGVLLGGVSLHEMWRAWHARRGRTERHLATVHADGVDSMMHQLLARVGQLEARDDEHQRRVSQLEAREDECQRRLSALSAVVQRQRRRITQLERQLQQNGIDVSLDFELPDDGATD
jgi:chromosome segregation ATPase